MHARRYLAVLALAALCTFAAVPAQAGDWGSIKGRVVLDGATPKPTKITVDADPKECLKNGDLYTQEYVVDEKTKGVRWCAVFLIPIDAETVPTAKLNINPAAEPKEQRVVIDQPCCQFEPRVICIRAGKQKLTVNNPAPMTHNIKIDGGPVNIDLNQAVPPNNKLEVPDDWKAAKNAIPFSCTIHKWMKGYIRVFNHTYYAVTNAKGEFEIKDAPKGKCRLVIWHETGWVIGDKEPSKFGVPIEIPDGQTKDLGDYKLKPEGR